MSNPTALGALVLIAAGAGLVACEGCPGGDSPSTIDGGTVCGSTTCTPPPPVCVAESRVRTVTGPGRCEDDRCVFDQVEEQACTDCCYGAEINLTGNPLGGGLGYSSIVDPSTATAVVSTASQLLDALASAQSGAVIYVEDAADIDVSTFPAGTAIPAGVTLASGRGRGESQGGLLYTDTTFQYPLFTADANVRVTGLRMRGPLGSMSDHDYDNVPHTGAISTSSPGFEIDNCELWNWGTSAVLLNSGSERGHVHHNYIHHTQRAGHGYGVTVGPSYPLIEGNIFDSCRHYIAGGGEAGTSYEARYNLVLEQGYRHGFDMHPDPYGGGFAGEEILIHHNTFRNVNNISILINGAPTSRADIHHNWFHLLEAEIPVYCGGSSGTNCQVSNNHFGPEVPVGTVLPVAAARAEPTATRTPTRITVDSSGSRDPLGGPVTTMWSFGSDGFGSSATHEYTEPGSYVVGTRVRDERGVVVDTFVSITSSPVQEGYWLDFWIDDTYTGPLTGRYVVEALLGDTVVWFRDVAQNPEGWQHVSVDVTPVVEGLSEAVLTFRTRCAQATTQSEIYELNVFIDDVSLFGGQLRDGHFEEGGRDWTAEDDGTGTFAAWFSYFAPRSGDVAGLLEQVYPNDVPAGAYASLSQTAYFLPQDLAAHWSFDENGGSSVQDYSAWGNHGTLVGTRTWTNLTQGLMSHAVSFDGIDDHVESAAVRGMSSERGSIMAWVKLSQSNQQTLFEMHDGSRQNRLTVGLTADNRVRAQNVVSGATRIDVTTVTALGVAEFHQVAVTQDGTALRVYLDGTEAQTTGTNGTMWTESIPTGDVWIAGGDAGSFAGEIDDVRVWTRSLDAATVADEYRQASPIVHWRLDESSGTIAADATGHGHDAVVRNAPSPSWVSGRVGGALQFDGVDDDLYCDQVANFSSPEGTIEFWIAPSDVEETWGDLVALVQSDQPPATRIYLFQGSLGRLYLRVEIDGTVVSQIQTERVFHDLEWHHVAVTQGLGGFRLYVDGRRESFHYGIPQPYWTNDLTVTSVSIGRFNVSDPFSGRLDDIKIWARRLSEDEIVAHAAGL